MSQSKVPCHGEPSIPLPPSVAIFPQPGQGDPLPKHPHSAQQDQGSIPLLVILIPSEDQGDRVVLKGWVVARDTVFPSCSHIVLVLRGGGTLSALPDILGCLDSGPLGLQLNVSHAVAPPPPMASGFKTLQVTSLSPHPSTPQRDQVRPHRHRHSAEAETCGLAHACTLTCTHKQWAQMQTLEAQPVHEHRLRRALQFLVRLCMETQTHVPFHTWVRG